MSTVFAAFTTGPLSWLTLLVAILVLALLGVALHRLSACLAENTQTSQAARLVDALGSVADGIVETLAAHPPAPAEVLGAVRAALIAQGVAYVKTAMPATIGALATTDGTLATRLGNEVSGAINAKAAAAPAVAAAVGQAVTAGAVAALAEAAPMIAGAIPGAAVLADVFSGAPTVPSAAAAVAAATAPTPGA